MRKNFKIKSDWAYFNSYSKHNIGQVKVHRFITNKELQLLVENARVCLNLFKTSQQMFGIYKFTILQIEANLQKLMDFKFFLELDLAEGFNQLRISKALQQINFHFHLLKM